MRQGDWMQTASGLAYYPCDPRAEDICITDIAHALSHICRFGGHCSRFYSVAEHSVLVSQVVPREYAMQGLLHDGTEAYVIDVPRPLKRSLVNYADIELWNWLALADKFGLPPDLHSSVKEADNSVLLAEKAALLGPSPQPWSIPGKPADVVIHGWPPEKAYAEFMKRYAELQP